MFVSNVQDGDAFEYAFGFFEDATQCELHGKAKVWVKLRLI